MRALSDNGYDYMAFSEYRSGRDCLVNLGDGHYGCFVLDDLFLAIFRLPKPINMMKSVRGRECP
jgi:hypothetical protein